MVTEQVIKEIYNKFNKPHKNDDELNLGYFLNILNKTHNIEICGNEIIIKSLEENNPFRRFLIRSLNTVLDFDNVVAFVFGNHILFLGKNDKSIRVHIKPEKNKSFFRRIFGK